MSDDDFDPDDLLPDDPVADDPDPTGLDERRSAMVSVADPVAELLAGLTNLPHPDDAAAWEQRDRELAARAVAEAARREREQLAARVNLFRSDSVRWPGRLVDDAIAADPMRPLIRRVDAFHVAAGDRGARHVLVLEGGVGVGKSTAATWWALRRGGRAPLYLRTATFEGEGRYDRDTRQRIREATSIVLDDVGAEYADGKGNFLSALEELVDVIYSGKLPAILITNLRPDDFWVRYGGETGRIRSRLRGCARWQATAGGDLRSPA